ncbi:MAG TPA: DHH family phosphoesterase [Ktedonobacteraceae bacterium]|nr:DHH family phosphoesterase [Ktedonobacteraceae bacterium]
MESGLHDQIDAALVEQAMALIRPAQHIALLAHEHPDGDCIGSALGMAFILLALDKTCRVVCADPPPRNLSFLPGIRGVQQTLGDEQFDLVIALDASELSRFGPVYTRHQTFLDHAVILNIDHHISNGGCGQVNIIDVRASATAELLVLFQQQAGLPLNRDAALCLLTGIITDTSSFQFTNTTPRTLETAALLMRHGVIPETVVQPIYRTRPLAQVRLQALAIDNARTACDDRLIWSHATDETLQAVGATPDMDDNLSGILRDIEGVQVAAFFKNYGDPATTRLSLRCAAPYNAAQFCQHYGGGGHARAAGATIKLPIKEAMQSVVDDLQHMMSGA